MNITVPYLNQNINNVVRNLSRSSMPPPAADTFVALTTGPEVQERPGKGESPVSPRMINVRDALSDVLELDPCRYEMIDQDTWSLYENGRSIKIKEGPVAAENWLRNLYLLQRLQHLIRTQEKAKCFTYTHVIVARADTILPEPLGWRIPNEDAIVVPHFDVSGGRLLNDRFAYGNRSSMVDTYLAQYSRLGAHTTASGAAETFLCCLIKEQNTSVYTQRIVVQRVRSSIENARGSEVSEKLRSEQQQLASPSVAADLARVYFRDIEGIKDPRQDPDCGHPICKKNLQSVCPESACIGSLSTGYSRRYPWQQMPGALERAV
jgi:hypothetical protein